MSITLRAKRILTGALAGALVLGLLPAGVASAATTACEGAASNQFADSNPTHQANIDCIAAYNVVSGFANGTFGGSQNITRGQMATFIANFAATTVNVDITDIEVASHTFTDVAGNVHADNIARIFGLGVTAGRTATTFAPNDTITRAEAATMLANAHVALGVDLTGVTPSTAFTDLGTSVHADNINILAGAGVVSGKTATTFAPSASILRAEAATLLVRSITVLRSQNLWDAPALVAPTTNQTFTVTSDDLSLLEKDADRTFVADVGDAETVSIVLVDSDVNDGGQVVVDGSNNVSFRDNSNNNEADLVQATGTDVRLTDVTTGEGSREVNVATGATDTAVIVEVVDGTVTFTVEGLGADAASVIPVVYEGEIGTDALEVDNDGLPTVDFGIGGETYFVDVDTLVIVAELTSLPFNGEATVTISVTTSDGIQVPLEGAEVVLYAERGSGLGTVDFNADPVYAPNDADNVIVDGLVLELDADGEVEFTWDGPDKPGITPTGETILDYLTVLLFGAQSGLITNASETATITWTDAPQEATTVTFGEFQQAGMISDSRTVTVTVLDQFGAPVEGADVVFTADRNPIDNPGDDIITAERTTNADGVATFTPGTRSAAAAWLITATAEADAGGPADALVLDADGEPIPVGDNGTDLWLFWAEDAEFEATGDNLVRAGVLGVDFDGEYVFVLDDGGQGIVRVSYGDADFYENDGAAIAKSGWVDALDAAFTAPIVVPPASGDAAITTADYEPDATGPAIIDLVAIP